MTMKKNPACSHGGCTAHESGEESCISRVPIFNHLEEGQMEEIMGLIHSASYEKGEVLYRAGEEADTLYILSQGKVRIWRLGENGKEQLLRILEPGDFTGETALFQEALHEDYASAMTEASICTQRREDFRTLLLKYPSISLKVLEEFSSRLGESEKRATRFATERVESRLAHHLLDLLPEGKEEITLPMSRKDLASYLGTTPETISRKLLELEAGGYIRQLSSRKLRILNQEGLLHL